MLYPRLRRERLLSRQKDLEKECAVLRAQRDQLSSAFGHNFAHISTKLDTIHRNLLRPLNTREG